jgi:curved DNA-binding protein CbpA
MDDEPLPDHYKVLGVPRWTDDVDLIKKRFHQLVLTYHPDKITDEDLRA